MLLSMFAFSVNSFAEGSDVIYNTYTAVAVAKLYDSAHTISKVGLPNLIDREVKVNKCITEYLEKNSKTYAKIVQDNLYDILNNIGRVEAKIYGRKYTETDRVARDKKLAALAKVQCEAYYAVGELK